MNRYILILSLFFSIIYSPQLIAQATDCIYFNEPEAGTVFSAETGISPGEVVHNYNDGTLLVMNNYTNNDGDTEFGELSIYEHNSPSDAAPSLSITNATATFVYTNPVSNVCFSTQIGESINFGINGDALIFDGFLDPELQASFPNQTISVSTVADTAYVCIQGFVDNFSIGSPQLLLDDVCSFPFFNSCLGTNFTLEAYCSNITTSMLTLDFDPLNTNNEFFDLFINDELFGFYPFESLPLTIPLNSGSNELVTVRIQENDNPDCVYTQTIITPICYTENCVGFEIFSDELEYALENDWPLNTIYYQEQGITFTTATAVVNGQSVEPNGMARFAPSDDFINSSGIFMGHWDMNTIVHFSDNQQYFNQVNLDFYYLGGSSNVFNFGINGQQIIEAHPPFHAGTSEYTFPDGSMIILEHFADDPNQGTLQFIGQDISEIRVGGAGLAMDNLCFGEVSCSISDLQVSQYACSDNVEHPNFYLNFNHGLVSPQDSFTLEINGIPYGIFNYAELPITGIDVAQEPGTVAHFLVRDQYSENCAEDINIEVHNCEFACADFHAEIAWFECIDTDFGYLNVVVNTPPTNGLFLLVGANDGNVYSSALYNNNSGLTFEVSTPTSNQSFLVIDQLTDCVATIDSYAEWMFNCGLCEIYDVVLSPTDCDENGQYYVTVYFESIHPENEFYIVLEGDQIFDGIFPFTATTIGPIDGANPHAASIDIIQINGACESSHEITYSCGNNPCFIANSIAGECDQNGNSEIIVYVEPGLSDNPLTLQIDGETVGVFGLNSFPIQTYIPFDPNQSDYVVTLIQEGTDCSYTQTVTIPCSNDCFSAGVELGECHSDGSADLHVGVASPLDGGPFAIYINGENFGAYNYWEFPVVLTSALIPGNDIIHIVEIFEVGGECSYTQDIVNDCTSSCEIYDVSVSGTECNNDGEYFLEINFESNINGSFEIFNTATGQGEVVHINDLPYLLGPININEIQTSEIQIISVNGECAISTYYSHTCIPQNECNFNDIYAEAYACDGDQFMVDIGFNNPSGGDLGFYIFGDGMIFGPYQYGETYYTFGPLNGSSSTDHTIMLLDIANPACFGNYNLNYACTEECQIISVNTETTECNNDGLFSVILNVEANHHGENFTVVGNGNNYGEFNYNDLPITLGPFEGDGVTEYEFGVIDLQNVDCTNWTSFISPNCQPCDIRDFTYEISCGEEYYELSIDFIYENPEANQFALIIGDEVYEWFEYSSLPLTLDFIPFSFNGETIRVEDIENELCGQTLEFDLPCCNLGNLLNELGVTDCNENGEYYLNVGNFNGGNLSDSLVIDYAPAGTSIIATVTVAYADLTEQIGPLVGDGSTGYLFVFRDQENQCTLTRTLEPVYCDNSSCVEFEGAQGVFGPGFEHDSNDLILEENHVNVTYERNPVTECACNLFILDGLLDVDFGNDHVIVTQNSGFGLNFSNVPNNFNTVNIDFYHPGADVSIQVNGQDVITASHFGDFPTVVAPGVELQVIFDANDEQQGVLTFNGNIESIQLFSNDVAAFDNICLSLDDNIWPGDTNADNYAGHFDLLNIGIAYGATGPTRNEVNEDWAGFIGQDWANNFADNTNYKHADANGDGVINEEDQIVLEQNYGLEHGPSTDFESLPYTDLDPPVFLDLPEGNSIPAGSAFEIPIVAGSVDHVIEDIYGLAFTLTVDPEVIDLSSLEIIYPTSWFGEPDVNTIHLHHINEDGNIEVAISRKDLNPVSGFGPIMYLRGIIDDIIAISPNSYVLMDKIHAIDNEESEIVLRPGGIEFEVTTPTPAFDRDMLRNTFSIFPNPTKGMVHFSNYYNMAADRISVYNSTGQHVLTVKEPDMHLDVSQLPVGVYHLKIHLQGFIFTERLVKVE